MVKLHREKAQVSYLSYPTFDRDPHPVLSTVLVCRLGELKLSYRDSCKSDNPPILHRKETFVEGDYPGREKFARLTSQKEKHDLLSKPTIGTQRGWDEALPAKSLRMTDHRLQRCSAK